MNVLITGHKGFIGQNFIRAVSNLGWYCATFDILDSPSTRPKELNISQYDWIIHLGAISSTTETDLSKLMDLNVSWTIELFEECVKHSTNMQWASSASVYGKRAEEQGPFRITDKCAPANLYAISKYLIEFYIASRKVPITSQGFRYFNVYGHNEDHKGTQASPYHQFEKQAKQTGVIKVFEGSEHFKRDFVHVSDLISIQLYSLISKPSGIYNIGSGNAKSFLDVAKEVSSMYNATIEIIPFPEQLKTHYQTYTCAG
jgi:ADP-L-glycero-D-manno-heptose 6-epimerase